MSIERKKKRPKKEGPGDFSPGHNFLVYHLSREPPHLPAPPAHHFPGHDDEAALLHPHLEAPGAGVADQVPGQVLTCHDKLSHSTSMSTYYRNGVCVLSTIEKERRVRPEGRTTTTKLELQPPPHEGDQQDRDGEPRRDPRELMEGVLHQELLELGVGHEAQGEDYVREDDLGHSIQW